MVSSSSTVDYYKELNINRHATSIDIRKAYKRLALIWHPDRNKDKDAEEKFKKIQQAYEVLSDENRRREYDQQQSILSQQKQNTRYETTTTTTNMDYTQPNEDSFHLHAFDNFMSNPIDPFDILNDIQFFQESDFTSKMMNSPGYRDFYTYIFDTMNNNSENNHHIYSASPIYLNNDSLFHPISNTTRSKHHRHHNKRSKSKLFSINNIPVIQSTMPTDWFLNELVDVYEQQNHVYIPSSYSSFNNDHFFDDLTHCINCHKKISSDRNHLIQHEQQCRQNKNRHTTIPSKTVRV